MAKPPKHHKEFAEFFVRKTGVNIEPEVRTRYDAAVQGKLASDGSMTNKGVRAVAAEFKLPKTNKGGRSSHWGLGIFIKLTKY